jgi:aminoglycoside/choline kinase family phosphotransferase
MGSSYRLTLECATPGAPTSIVAKMPSGDAEMSATVAPGYKAEIGFYRELVDRLAVRTPACHGTAMNEDGSVFVLLMEDMSPAEQGDQFAGATPAVALDAVRNLAGLHGPLWCDPTLAQHDFFNFTGAETQSFLGELMVSATEVFLERYAGRVSEEDGVVLRDAAALMGPLLQARADRFSVVHGDYRMDNLLVHPDGTVTAVDWQSVSIGLPGRDLAYFCSTSLTVEDRRAREDELVRAYHEALLGYGVEDHPLEECFDDYRFAMVSVPLFLVLGAAYGTPTERGDDMFVTLAERFCTAIRDHGSNELVRAEVAP